MAKTRTIEFDDQLDVKIGEYAKRHGFDVNVLVNFAVEKYIADQTAVELVPVDSKKWEKLTEETFAEHKEAMDELK